MASSLLEAWIQEKHGGNSAWQKSESVPTHGFIKPCIMSTDSEYAEALNARIREKLRRKQIALNEKQRRKQSDPED